MPDRHRPRYDALMSWLPVRPRHLRGHRGTLGELVAARPCRRDRNPGGQTPQVEGALHRLRREGSVHLLYGTRRFVRRLNELEIVHRYDEFQDNHSGVDYRMDESLPFLAQALSG
jgi:hypothetical protein